MTSRVRFGEYECDLRSGELFEGGRRIRLPEQPMIVLSALLERPGDVVTRDELRRRLWDGDTFVDFDIGLNKAVAKLREALNDHAGAPRFIETLPKRGYRWISDVVPLNGNGSPTSAAVDDPPAPVLHAASPARRPWLLIAILALAVVALLSTVAVDWVQRRLAAQRLTLPPRVAQAIAGDRKVTVSVPDFMCEECDDPRRAQALRAETIAALGRQKAAHLAFVSPRSSETRPQSDYNLEGTVVREPSKTRVTARLVRTSDARQMWAETIEPFADGEQPAIAMKIARSVRLALAPLEMPERYTARSGNSEARDEYLKGLYLQTRQGRAAEATAHFERATMLDPQFCDAWAGLALSQMYLRPAIFQTKAIVSAQRALELNSQNADAWVALGYARMILQWDWPAAKTALLKARELEPRNSRAAIAWATWLATTGKLEEAIAMGNQAARLDPLSPLIAQIVGRFYYFNHQPQLAMYEWSRSLQIDPDFYWSHLFLSFRFEDERSYDRWYTHFRRARAIGATEAQLAQYDRAAAALGTAGLAERVFQERVREAEAGRAEAGSVAIGYARRGDHEKALDWIEKALERKGIDMTYLKVEPAYDGMRSHPRFKAAMAKVKIP